MIATISGIFGALVGNPFDVVLVRKQAGINVKNNNVYSSNNLKFSTINNTIAI